MPERAKRKSRVLEHFEKKAETTPEAGGGENPFQDLDAAFGLDGFGPKDDK